LRGKGVQECNLSKKAEHNKMGVRKDEITRKEFG